MRQSGSADAFTLRSSSELTDMALIQGFTVWCDADNGKGDDEMHCCAMDQASGSKREVGKLFKSSGWKQTRKGWICPECAQELGLK